MARALSTAEDLTQALKRGVLSAVDAAPRDLLRLFYRMVAIVVLYAILLQLLGDALRPR